MWQTDFIYFKVIRWAWFYLSTILDDYSRYIVTWKLQNSYQSEVLERELSRFVHNYNNERVYESLDNETPAEVYHGRHRQILDARQRLKIQTTRRRRCYNRGRRPGKEELIRPSVIREGVL